MELDRRRLALFRHAKSDQSSGKPDVERPLAARGRRDAPAAGAWLRDNLPGIDLCLCSVALRARQTWEAAVAELGDAAPPVRYEERLYGAYPDEILEVVGELEPNVRTVVVVAHNPGLQELLALLTDADEEMPTSAIAVVSWAGGWADTDPGSARLEELAVPRGR